MDEKAYQERNASQKPAIELLQTMGYIYIPRRTAKSSVAAGIMFF